jgi:tetratricopeptide (TPR) repeat protein
MADESERSGRNTMPDPAAMALAVGGASRARADEYLAKQSRLADLQVQDLEREDAIRHWSLRVHHISDVLKLTFELALAMILGAVVLLIAVTAWSAAHEDGLVIEAFSVPPDMTAQGLTGQAIAAKLQDRLAAMQNQTDSGRPAASYSNNWGGDIKVQIPDTGVSIGEFYRMLTAWFGHQSHITGEIYRTKSGLSISVRASGDGGDTVTGSEANIDALVEKAAESIYSHTQPYRFAVYEQYHGRVYAARDTYRAIIASDTSARERAWAWLGLGVNAQFTGDPYGAEQDYRRAIALVPDFALGWSDLDPSGIVIGHPEPALQAARKAVALFQGGNVDLSERARAVSVLLEQSDADLYVGDYANAIHACDATAALPDYGNSIAVCQGQNVTVAALMHDPKAARERLAAAPVPRNPDAFWGKKWVAFSTAHASGDWSQVEKTGNELIAGADAAWKAHTFSGALSNVVPPVTMWPNMAYARAEQGDMKGALALIARTPLDCYACLRTRGALAALRHDKRGADYWYARATALAPSIPMGWAQWGETLLREGNFDGAIAKFEIANQKGPKFADPLELWGEALIAKNRSDLATAKFEEADKYAPNWGRLHLEWGKALFWTGDKAGAQQQFAAAAALALTAEEQAVLSRLMSRRG